MGEVQGDIVSTIYISGLVTNTALLCTSAFVFLCTVAFMSRKKSQLNRQENISPS